MMQVMVMLPTFNERQSVGSVIKSLLELEIQSVQISIMVIDDSSPDGTADYVRSLNLDNVEVLQRPNKDGLGTAYKAGIEKALKESDVTHLVSMDADSSHRVADLSRLIESARSNPTANLVIGSRWVPGGAIENWPFARKFLSKLGTKYAQWALNLEIKDLTGGFRVYPRRTLERLDLSQITSNGYCYQIEMAYAISHLQGEIIEVPITFVERREGVSKMSNRIVLEAMVQVTRWGLTRKLSPSADKLHYVK